MLVRVVLVGGAIATFLLAMAQVVAGQSLPASSSSAWYDHAFHVDASGVVGRSTIVLQRPSETPGEAMPLGNGDLGAAVWAADGLTVQLNRVDTLPRRLSPGQLVLHSLSRLTEASDYRGMLDLYNGEFRETGAGMTATAYVQPGRDIVVVDVAGADPKQRQIADLRLWPPRVPTASVHGEVGTLEEQWRDDTEPGASGRRFGSVAALTGQGRDVRVTRVDARTLRLSVLPKADGTYRILVASPSWHTDAKGPMRLAQALSGSEKELHRRWWHAFWDRAGLIRVDSADGVGEYMETLRQIYLYAAAAEHGTEMPGSQAGVADLFSAVRDTHRWDPAAFWHLNLRMQTAANIGAGLPELNESYFRLYRDDLPEMKAWTRERMHREGLCLPETMRFNGNGIEYETGGGTPIIGLNCDANSKPYYNARTLSSGAEVSLWIWQQYLLTRDQAFLAQNYPVMREAALFLLAYEAMGADGRRHTSPSNAHETQWDVLDPVTDLCARRTLYDEAAQAATILGRDATLVARMKEAARLIPDFPRTPSSSPGPGASDGSVAVIAESAEPNEPQHNVENIGLEPVWPYGLIGDDSPDTTLARQTYQHRPFRTNQDWSFDPVQAARLGLADEVKATLIQLTDTYQAYPNGFANWGGDSGEFYVEQSGVTALALQESLVQDYDGLVRIAPAVPLGWDVSGTVAARDGMRVHVQIRAGVVDVCVLEARRSASVRLRNPWAGEPFRVRDDRDGQVVATSEGKTVTWPAIAGHAYVVERAGLAVTRTRQPVTGEPNTAVKHLRRRSIGLAAAR